MDGRRQAPYPLGWERGPHGAESPPGAQKSPAWPITPVGAGKSPPMFFPLSKPARLGKARSTAPVGMVGLLMELRRMAVGVAVAP